MVKGFCCAQRRVRKGKVQRPFVEVTLTKSISDQLKERGAEEKGCWETKEIPLWGTEGHQEFGGAKNSVCGRDRENRRVRIGYQNGGGSETEDPRFGPGDHIVKHMREKFMQEGERGEWARTSAIFRGCKESTQPD